MICMLWDECVDQTFDKHICQKDNFMHLNGKNVLYPHAAEIVWEYLEKNENNFEKLFRAERFSNMSILSAIQTSIF